VTAQARFRQTDVERVFRAAKRAEVRARIIIKPTGEIEAQMLTEGEEAEQGSNSLRRKVFGGQKT
jgi:hypothetical protein